MELRTTFDISPSSYKITYNDPAMFIGSCFATSIGKMFESGHLPVMINPAGTVYNPVSVLNTIKTIADGREYTISDLYNNNGLWISFNHYTDFSSPHAEDVLKKINDKITESHNFLSVSSFLFVTFGTARIYRWKGNGNIVSNCHKIPADKFTDEILSVEEIKELWICYLDELHTKYPALKVIFTISPVRHWKDGAHGNQVSKSVLFLAVEELMKHPAVISYFPAYELVMDDLRDYRFYDDDMLHLSSSAINYIWEEFSKSWFDEKTIALWREINKISMAVSHRIQSGSKEELRQFAEKMLTRIQSVNAKNKSINLESERKYFLSLL
jgi:hypothetical protein